MVLSFFFLVGCARNLATTDIQQVLWNQRVTVCWHVVFAQGHLQ